jgi:apolipoprotein N-acyltransferase
MTLGDGILASTVLVLLSIAIWQIAGSLKFLFTLRNIAVAVGLSCLAMLGFMGWQRYEQRPKKPDEVRNITLGMTQADVLVELGKPSDQKIKNNEKYITDLWNYESENLSFIVAYDSGNKKAVVMCEQSPRLQTPFGYKMTQKDITEKLGEYASASYTKDQLKKRINFPSFNVAFYVEGGVIIAYCVSEAAKIALGDLTD